MVFGKKEGGKIVDQDGSGKATIDFPSGSKYVGELKNGMAEGLGTMYFEDDRQLTGTFVKGKPHGNEIVLTFPDGRKFIGDYTHGRRHGYGRMFFPNGKKYEGEWKNDLPHGEGSMIHPDGTIEQGTWVRGRRIDPSAREGSGANLNRTLALVVILVIAGILIYIFW